MLHILIAYAKSLAWDHETFIRDFERSECYHPPLKLEDGKPGTFLETSFEITNGRFRYWLKNDNEQGVPPTVWRYQHWSSNTSYLQKRALITSCLKKVHKMASDPQTLYKSGIQKLAEFHHLRYPTWLLKAACNYIGASTGEGTWIGIRNTIAKYPRDWHK